MFLKYQQKPLYFGYLFFKTIQIIKTDKKLSV